MTCGINLGILLIVFIQAVHICCSWVLPDGEGSRTDRTNTPVGLSHVRGRFEGSRPQDEFRQAYVVKISSTGARADQRPYAHTASLAFPVKFSQSSQTNPKGSNVDTSYGNVRPKNTFGLSTSIASGSSVSKQDSKQDSKQHNGVLRTWPGQQGAVRTSQYVYSKPDSHSSKQTLLSQSRSQKPTALKQMHGLDKGTQGLKWNSKLTPPKEYVKATSGLSHGRKVTGGSRKSPYLPSRLGQTSQLS
ncbi:uncharacterized protein [Eucyclogobius newberryi]|uniref:uncharacterized protein n=1 Tax=Eucyclogobius newberryi TaxID=166745 RepID=UPI003B5CF654